MQQTELFSDEDASSRVDALLQISENFFAAVGLHKDLMHEIFHAENDWTFILKVDALLETATKELIKSGLSLKILGRFVGTEELADFIDALPMNGKTSLLQLLKASGCPADDVAFVGGVRRVRNAYAHNIRVADLPLIELIKQRQDKSRLIRDICNIRTYNETDLIASYEKDRKFLRFCILDATMRILYYAYHIALKRPSAHLESTRPDGFSGR
jgi:hypothetical protein